MNRLDHEVEAADPTDLRDRSIVVTGAGSGLGRAFGVELAARGASLVLNDVDATSLEQTCAMLDGAGERAVAVAGSVASADVVEAMFDACESTFGRVHGLVNNAGTFLPAPAQDVTEAEVRLQVEVNVIGSLLCGTTAFRRIAAGGGGGTILNVTSGAFLGVEGMSVYGATKGAIASATYAWALEGRRFDINVNALSPIAATGLTARWVSAEKIAGQMAPESVAPVAAYLMSPSARSVTGQVVRTDGRRVSLVAAPALAARGVDHAASRSSVADAMARLLADASLPGRHLPST